MKSGYFITFEGPDGAGKTTVINKLVDLLNLGDEVLLTREPGGSKIAEKIREIILDPKNEEMDDKTEALLYAAARAQHLEEVINPALKAGKLVISDRYLDSSLAYQGMGRGLGIDAVYQINQFATDGLLPDLTILLDLKPEEGLKRIGKYRSEDRLELAGLEFHQKVYTGYQEVAKKYPERVKMVDASQSVDQVVADCLQLIKENLPNLVKGE